MYTAHTTREAYAYTSLREKILSGSIPPGAALREIPLAKKIGASRTPIRHAILQLQRDGLVVHSPGVGAFVKEHDEQEIRELAQVRLALEKLAAGLAAQYATPSHLAELKAVCDDMLAMAREASEVMQAAPLEDLYRRSVATDQRFHQLLLEAAGNNHLRKTVGDMNLISRIISQPHHLPTNPPRYFTNQYRGHHGIYRAVRSRNPELAARRMEKTTSIAIQLAEPG